MKKQSDIQKERELERERSIKEDTLNAIHRVRKNEYFTVNDLKKVQKELRRQNELGFKNASSLENVASNLQKEISHSSSNEQLHKRRFRRRRHDVERFKRQQKMQMQKKYEQNKGIEL